MSGFGFKQIKKTEPTVSPAGRLDLTGINLPPPILSTEQEEQVIQKAESLGFSSREPSVEPVSPVVLNKQQKERTVQYDTVFIKGPIHIIAAFRQYTSTLGDPEEGAVPLWKGLKHLMENQK